MTSGQLRGKSCCCLRRSALQEPTMLSVTAAREARWSSRGSREKFLSHHVFTK